MARILTLVDSDWIEEVAPEWEALHRGSTTATPFHSPAWLRAWSETVGRRFRPEVWLIREGNDLVGLFPLTRTRAPWVALRGMASGMSDLLHPLAAPGYEQVVSAAIRDRVNELDGVHLLDLHQIRADHPLADLVHPDEIKPQAECPVLTLPATFEEYLATLSKSLRTDVNRGLKKNPEIRTVADGSDPVELLEQFFDLHGRRWKKRGLPGAFGFKRVREFHRNFVRKAAPEDLWLSVFRHEGEPIGAIYALRTGGHVSFYQSGFSPDHRALCPGSVLIGWTIRRAIEEGCHTFDFLRGVEPYKLRWKPQRVVTNLRWMRHSRPGWGRFALAVNQAEARIEARIRQRLEGRGLVG